MGVSFKISKLGRRFCPKPILTTTTTKTSLLLVQHQQLQVEDEDEDEDQHNNIYFPNFNHNVNINNSKTSNYLVSAPNLQANVASTEAEELEVSFTLNLFPDGFTIGKPSENQPSFQAMLQNPPKFLHPYDRTSEALFSAIESGQLPGDILDDILCKYVDGTVVCEVRDYRSCYPEGRLKSSSNDVSPITNKVRLRMSSENVIRDIPLISDNTWTYGDLIEFESRIVKTLQPQLCLDPAPKLDRLCEIPVQKKLNLDIRSMRKRRREIPEVIVTSSNLIHGKKVCIDKVANEGSILGNSMPQNTHENAPDLVSNNAKTLRAAGFVSDASFTSRPFVSQPSKYALSEGAPTMMRGRATLSNVPGAFPSGQNIIASFREREIQDGPVSPVTSLNERARVTSMDSLQGSDLQWNNNTLLNQNQLVGRGFQYPNNGMRFPKEETAETVKSECFQNRNEMNLMEAERIRMQQRLSPPNAFMRSNFTQPACNNFSNPIIDNNFRKEDQVQKRKLSEVSSKSGEISIKDNLAVNQVPAVGWATSMNSCGNDNSMIRQQKVQLPAKRRSNSLPKTSAMISGIGSPASVGNMSVPFNANSPVDEMLTQIDPTLFDRFSKIELVSARHQINHRKFKVDDKPIRKPCKFSTQEIMVHLSNESSGKQSIDESESKELETSCVGGSLNACKIRVLTFVQNERIMQGNGFALVPKSHVRMMLSANPSDGTIAMHYGGILESDSLFTEDYLPTLHNTHLADLLAAQLSSLMTREGYEIEDKIYPKPNRVNHAQQNSSGTPQTNTGMEIQQYSDVNSGQHIRPTNTNNLSQTPNHNVVNQRMMLPPQNSHALQISQGLLSGVNEPQSSSLQQHSSNQLQRSQVMFQPNQLPQGQNPNTLLANNQMIYKPSHLQIQLMQQQTQGKMIMGTGANNMGGNSVMGGIGGPTISGIGHNNIPMNNIGASSNISNAISQHLRNGQLTSQAMVALRMGNRGNMMGGTQSNLGGIPGGARQMHPGSMLGHSLINRGMGPSPMQRSVMGPMGPPKLMSGMNIYMSPQQQQQLQQQRQLQMQTQQIQQNQQFQQQQLHQQQDLASPLQSVVSLPQQISQPQQQQPEASPQQMIQRVPMSPQQISQRTPMSPQQLSQRTPMSPQHSSGAVHPLNNGNSEVCPASPQLSSQALGSVSNIANSSMDHLEDVNNNNKLTHQCVIKD